MDPFWKNLLWSQFGASIDTLENSIKACPEQLWSDHSRKPEYWHLVFHTLVFLDLYCSESLETFAPPAPFSRDELGQRGQVHPKRLYTRDELLGYLEYGREKGRALIASMTEEHARKTCPFPWIGNVSNAEVVMYNTRHIQHHAAQLNLIMRQAVDSAPGWVFKAKAGL